MPSCAPRFTKILDDLAKRQLRHDFEFGAERTNYEALRSIGSGAFGVVCEAEDHEHNKRVAVKKIGHASATPTLARRTLREIRVLRYIRHPNIIRLRDVFRTPGSLGMNVFLVMDIMSFSLHQVIHGSQEPLDYELISLFTQQLLRGVRFLHAAQIAHRDLKPSNLLVNSNCHLCIADFGMAKLSLPAYVDESTTTTAAAAAALSAAALADDKSFYMTQHIATLPYRAPELLFVMPDHSCAVDIKLRTSPCARLLSIPSARYMYAVACIFAEMILRRELFPGRCVGSQIKTVLSHLGSPPAEMIASICCEKTRAYVTSFGTQPPRPWRETLASAHHEPNAAAVDFVSRLARIDPKRRIDVHEALAHPFFRPYNKDAPSEAACPFRVKMDMAAVECLNHAELVSMIEADVRSAELEIETAANVASDTKRRNRRQRAATTINTISAAERPSSSGASSTGGYTMSETSSGSVNDSYDLRSRGGAGCENGDARVRRRKREDADALQRAQRSMSTGFYSAEDDASPIVDELGQQQQITAL